VGDHSASFLTCVSDPREHSTSSLSSPLSRDHVFFLISSLRVSTLIFFPAYPCPPSLCAFDPSVPVELFQDPCSSSLSSSTTVLVCSSDFFFSQDLPIWCPSVFIFVFFRSFFFFPRSFFSTPVAKVLPHQNSFKSFFSFLKPLALWYHMFESPSK